MSVPTSELNRRIDENSWAERRFRSVPLSAQELRCKCFVDDPLYIPVGGLYDRLHMENNKYVCKDCGLPTRYSLVSYLEECEACDGWFIVPQFPDKRPAKLCADCDAKVPARRVAKRPGN